MGWARLLPSPQTMTPVAPTWERPRANIPGAMQAAQKYLADQQALESAKAEAPISLAMKQAQLVRAQHDVGRMGVGDEMEDLRLGQARSEAATADEMRPLETEARKADLTRRIQSGEIGDAEIKRAAVVGEGIRYVFSLPDGSAEQAAAWDTFIQTGEAAGVFRPEQAAIWRKHGPDKRIARQALDLDATIKQALKDVGGGRSAYGDQPIQTQIALDNQARIEAEAVVGKPPDQYASDEQVTKYQENYQRVLAEKRAEVYARHGVDVLPAGMPGSAYRIPPIAEGAQKAAAGAGSIAADKSAKEKELPPVKRFSGDLDNIEAYKKWFESLPDGAEYYDERLGEPRRKATKKKKE